MTPASTTPSARAAAPSHPGTTPSGANGSPSGSVTTPSGVAKRDKIRHPTRSVSHPMDRTRRPTLWIRHPTLRNRRPTRWTSHPMAFLMKTSACMSRKWKECLKNGQCSCGGSARAASTPKVAVFALRKLRPRGAGGLKRAKEASHRTIRCAAERGATGRSATRSSAPESASEQQGESP